MKEMVPKLTPKVSSRIFIIRLAAAVLAINLFVIVLASISIYQSRRYYKERVEVQVQNLSQALELTIDAVIDKADMALLAMVHEVEEQIAAGGSDEKEINSFIAQHLTLLPELDGLRVTNAQGDVVYGTGVVPGVLLNNGDRDFFIEARDSKMARLYMTKPVFGRVAQRWVFHISRRINKPDGSFAGVAYGVLPLDYFVKLFANFNVGRHGTITMRDGDLAIVAQYPSTKGTSSTGLNSLTAEFRELIHKNRASGTYTASAASDNIERTYSYCRISSYPLYVTVGRATSDYLADWWYDSAKIMSLVALFVFGTLVSAWVVYRNWSGKMQAQEDLYRYQEHLEELVKSRTTELEAFNYTVSHDLRKPLTVISGYCGVIGDMYAGRLDKDGQGYLSEIENSVARMSSMIDSLLNFSRLSDCELKRTTVNLSDIAREVIDNLKVAEPHRRVVFRVAEGLTATGDQELLRIVLDNLLGNAWKYTYKQEEAVIEFGVTDFKGETVYFVRDNGSGFDMKHADEIFIPFRRLPEAHECKGFGVGLATVGRIIKHHGGRIWAEGEPGKGATFYFTL